MIFEVLMTGSDGNCSVLHFENTTILIDAGFKTKKKMEEVILPVLEKYKKIDGIIITHNHSDHFYKWTGRLAMDYSIPLYLHPRHYENEETRKEKFLSYEDKKAGISYTANVIETKEEQEFKIGSINIMPFTSYHDASKTLGFVFNDTFGYLTDCGFISNNIKNILKNVSSLALEFNYEIDRLIVSDRHWSNKLRTMGRFGHLSNEEAAKFCKFLSTNGELKKVITMHPSDAHNDTEEIAARLDEIGVEYVISNREGNEAIEV